jgi:MurNAc alpha-1-phosphate uridylyltransferase
MRAMILAAGRGERMRPLTDTCPKPLLEVGGTPLIVWHIRRLVAAGITEIVVNHAWLGARIEAALGNGSQWGAQIHHAAESTALETAGGIANAMHLLTENGTKSEPFLVVNGDTFTEFDFASLSQHIKSTALWANTRAASIDIKNTRAHLVLVHNPPQHPNGDFAIANGLLKNTGEQMLTFSGVGVYHPDLFADVVIGQPAKLAPLLRKAIDSNAATAEYYQGVWHDIGTPERLKNLDKLLLNV